MYEAICCPGFRTALRRAAVAALILLLGAWALGAQGIPYSGHDVAPVYEGWQDNPDGSFDMLFGYFNRNQEQELDVPVGADNRIEPGGPDLGQPTHFYPQRNRFVFRVRVPPDFGNRELVWTLTSNGRTNTAHGILHPDYYTDNIVIMNNQGAGGQRGRRQLHQRQHPAEAAGRRRAGADRRGGTAGHAVRDGDRRRHPRAARGAAAAAVGGRGRPRAPDRVALLSELGQRPAAVLVRLSGAGGARDVRIRPSSRSGRTTGTRATRPGRRAGKCRRSPRTTAGRQRSPSPSRGGTCCARSRTTGG